jgi:hypothetical protein
MSCPSAWSARQISVDRISDSNATISACLSMSLSVSSNASTAHLDPGREGFWSASRAARDDNVTPSRQQERPRNVSGALGRIGGVDDRLLQRRTSMNYNGVICQARLGVSVFDSASSINCRSFRNAAVPCHSSPHNLHRANDSDNPP